MPRARLSHIELPDFGSPSSVPTLPPQLYRERLRRLRVRMVERGYDRLVFYADREHSANLAWLSGFDPRFEEALLVLGPEGEPLLLTGNECLGLGRAAPLPLRVELWQDLSLPGQPRDRSRPLAEILTEAGLVAGARVGVVGWKPFADRAWLDVPAFLAEALRRSVAPGGDVENAVGLLIDPGDGLRTVNEPEQLAAFEYAACHTSEGVKRVLFGLRPGMTEQEAVALLGWNGAPLSCHLMLSSGSRASLGLLSPSDRVIERGDRFTTAYGIWGALDCRAGFVVADASELPADIDDYVERLAGPYFEAIVEWLEALRVGQAGGVLHEIIARHLGDPFFGIFLNPGHLIGLDEWVHSPVTPGSEIRLRSGAAMQVDVIPATGSEYFTTNIEGGLALADEPLREELAARYPEAWVRITKRRSFMRRELGIRLHDDVLPLSNLPAYLAPFLLAPERALTVRPEM
jgi:Xaa-Pro aminopeptidase